MSHSFRPQAIKLASLGAVCAINYASNTSRAEELLGKLTGSRDRHTLIQGSMFTKPEAQAVVAVGSLTCMHNLIVF